MFFDIITVVPPPSFLVPSCLLRNMLEFLPCQRVCVVLLRPLVASCNDIPSPGTSERKFQAPSRATARSSRMILCTHFPERFHLGVLFKPTTCRHRLNNFMSKKFFQMPVVVALSSWLLLPAVVAENTLRSFSQFPSRFRTLIGSLQQGHPNATMQLTTIFSRRCHVARSQSASPSTSSCLRAFVTYVCVASTGI